MISRLGATISRVFERSAPDPFVLAVLLTLVTAVLALTLGTFPGKPDDQSRVLFLLDSWRADTGLWRFLTFGMQMCLILVTGHALAASKPVRGLIGVLAGAPWSGGSAAAMVGLVASVFGLINWGLGLIVGALLARDVGKSLESRGIRAHYPLLAAAGYMGLLVWHGGLSGSAPLTMTTRAGAEKVLPASVLERFGQGVPLRETLFSPMNLIAAAGVLVIIPVMLWLLSPGEGQEARGIGACLGDGRGPSASLGSASTDCDHAESGRAQAGARASSGAAPRTFPDWLHETPWLAWGLGLAFIAGAVRFASVSGLGRLGLNEINMAMLGLGLLMHASTSSYVRAVEDGARGCAGVILQFPLYAGIMALLVSSGLIDSFSRALAEAGNQSTIPLMTYLSAAVVNMFVPSGGGQWGIQGPIALDAGAAAGIEPGKMIMAVAYGDQLTNMLQPFWALPLLAITGVKAREIVGYTCVVMAAVGVWLGVLLVVF
ncbi:MAG: short-chain fatty acid transporter [Phycisphaeraceae bacterium]|nr:MAG: short-chain fatty acid transporter [Phycisphaeraceae bacterium]